MPKRTRFKAENLSRLITYILGYRPDEFCLVPDGDGYVTYKELLQALHEEAGWGYVREGHLNEVLMGRDRPLFQENDKKIRACDRRWHMDREHPVQALPGLLYTAIRGKAHPHVMDKGLKPADGKDLLLVAEKEMAVRMGRRKDPHPVILEVMASIASGQGVLFYPFGDLFLAEEIPARFIAGPPVAKEIVKARTEEKGEKKRVSPDPEPGTLILDVNRDPDLFRREKGKKPRGWKERARKERRRG